MTRKRSYKPVVAGAKDSGLVGRGIHSLGALDYHLQGSMTSEQMQQKRQWDAVFVRLGRHEIRVGGVPTPFWMLPYEVKERVACRALSWDEVPEHLKA